MTCTSCCFLCILPASLARPSHVSLAVSAYASAYIQTQLGINLSGGQKQRVSIARTAYSRHQLVLLDDPLSALDPEVGEKVFDNCIVKLMKSRTVVLVTNQLNLLAR
jgi:ABC-type bacteriocin/lantibiotic exporter with double-glycine peptidase domain